MRGGGRGDVIQADGVHSGRVVGALPEDTPLAAKHMLCYHAQPLLHHSLCHHCYCSLQSKLHTPLTYTIAAISDVSVISLGLGCNTANCLDKDITLTEAQSHLTALLEQHANSLCKRLLVTNYFVQLVN